MIRALVIGLAGAALLAGCGGSRATAPVGSTNTDAATTTSPYTPGDRDVPTTSDATTATTANEFRGGKVSPVTAAPEFGLRTQDGRMIRLRDYRGKVVLVTFVYTSCPDVCPLIVDNLLRVSRRLGRDADRMQIVAVSVDPVGDTPAAVRRFLVAHGATDTVDYLIGSRPQLEAAWARWNVAAQVSKENPALIEHSGVIWGLDPQGRRATFYPAVGFEPSDIEADVRLLLRGA